MGHCSSFVVLPGGDACLSFPSCEPACVKASGARKRDVIDLQQEGRESGERLESPTLAPTLAGLAKAVVRHALAYASFWTDRDMVFKTFINSINFATRSNVNLLVKAPLQMQREVLIDAFRQNPADANIYLVRAPLQLCEDPEVLATYTACFRPAMRRLAKVVVRHALSYASKWTDRDIVLNACINSTNPTMSNIHSLVKAPLQIQREVLIDILRRYPDDCDTYLLRAPQHLRDDPEVLAAFLTSIECATTFAFEPNEAIAPNFACPDTVGTLVPLPAVPRTDAELAAHFRELGLEQSAHKDEIKLRFRSLARIYHADKGGSKERFQRVLQAYEVLVAHTKSEEEQIARLKEAYAAFDKDGKGYITTQDLARVTREFGENKTQAELIDMIRQTDSSGTGVIDFPTFSSFMIRRVQATDPEEDFIEAFKVYDVDGDGFISFSDVKSTMRSLGEELTDDEVTEMIREADIDGDGRINYEEFVAMMMAK